MDEPKLEILSDEIQDVVDAIGETLTTDDQIREAITELVERGWNLGREFA